MRTFALVFVQFLTLRAHGLINGAPLGSSPDVVRIRLTNDWVCSGVYIDPYTILTAAHCIYSSNPKEVLKIDLIQEDNDKPLDVKAVQLLPNPKYSSQYWPAYDVGMIKTTKNQKFAGNFQLEEHGGRYRGGATLYGCGKTNNGKSYSRTFGENRFLRIGSVLFFIGESSDGKGAPGINVSVAPNDSGGPIVDKTTGRIIGVMTTTTFRDSEEYGLPTLSTGTSTSAEDNLNFIRDHLGP